MSKSELVIRIHNPIVSLLMVSVLFYGIYSLISPWVRVYQATVEADAREIDARSMATARNIFPDYPIEK